MPRSILRRAAVPALALTILLLAFALLSCKSSSSNESSPSSSAHSPAAGGTRGGSGGATDTCKPGNGPPKEGTGPPGLPGRITFVRLVFGCQPDIYTANADGSNATALTTDPGLDDEVDLSADGQKVVFFSNRSGNAFLYTENIDGSGLAQLTSGPGGDTSPRWSPDGSQIAYSHSGSLVVMNADGSNARTIMELQPAASAEPCRAGAFVGGWSPDGQKLTYYSAIIRPGGDNIFWVCSINQDGSDIKVLVADPAGKLHAEPYWSPDGTKIVFRDDRDGDCSQPGTGKCNYDIFVLDLTTGQQTNVTKDPKLDIEPTWSPDGQWILFASNREDPNFDLYIIHPDGSGLTRILNDPDAKDSYPSWR